jgi:signal transduction histidine kinase
MERLRPPVSPLGAMSLELLDNLPIALFVADGAGRPIYMNRTGHELLGKGLAEDATVEQLPEIYEAYEAGTDTLYPFERTPLFRALQGEGATADDLEIHRPDRVVRLQITSVPIFDADGSVALAVAAFEDITERKRAETELRLTHELALAISGAATVDDALGLAVRRVGEQTGWPFGQAWVPDATGSYLEATPIWHGEGGRFDWFRASSAGTTFARGAGLPGAAWATRKPVWVEDLCSDPTFGRSIAARDVGLCAALAVPVLAGDEAVAVLEFFLGKRRPEDDGTQEMISTVAAQLGAFVRRRQAEDALRNSERELRALDRIKNTFLEGVSHELRTPLGAMRGISVLLARDLERPEPKLSTAEQHTLLEQLAGTAKTMNRLLDDLLDLDRLVLGILKPERVRADVGELVRQAIAESGAATDRIIEIETDRRVMGVDQSKLERIVENLLSNAAKYSPADTPIWVRVRGRPDGVLLMVDDEGEGVPEELRQTIFEPFSRGLADSSGAPGLGIGLSLVAAFADLHGGRAWVDDRDGGGASFRVFLADETHLPEALARIDGGHA